MSQPFALGRAGPKVVARFLREAAATELTYADVGATRGDMPTGYRHHHVRGVLGASQAVFGRACEGLRGWQAHRGAGLDVYPDGAPLETGTTVLVVVRLGPIHARAACRIVYVVDEPDCYGFAYGTLPLHPEEGEEAFLVERAAHDTVTFRIEAFSRPGHIVSRLGGPVTRRFQDRAMRAYAAAMQDWCAVSG